MSSNDAQNHPGHHFLGHLHPHGRKSTDSTHRPQPDELSPASPISESPIASIPEPRLPDLDLPHSELDLTTTFESIMAESATVTIPAAEPEVEKVQKRASNVLKLSQENEKLKEELRAMNERLEAAERKQQELRRRAEHV